MGRFMYRVGGGGYAASVSTRTRVLMFVQMRLQIYQEASVS